MADTTKENVPPNQSASVQAEQPPLQEPADVPDPDEDDLDDLDGKPYHMLVALVEC